MDDSAPTRRAAPWLARLTPERQAQPRGRRWLRWRNSLLLTAAFGLTGAAKAAPPVEVMVVASMHGLHRTSGTYPYDDLYAVVRDFHPDLVGVELRPEDLHADAAYLANNYPTEMIELSRDWGPRAFGFDWLGDDLAGRPIPDGYWAEQSPVKRLERALDADPLSKDARLAALAAQEQALLAAATAATLNDGRYDRLNNAYYAAFKASVARSPYAPIADFYAARDRHIDANIVAAIRANPGKRVVVVTGADHRSFVVAALKKAFGRSLRLAPVVRNVTLGRE
jgi:hypothetical protein